MAEFYGTEYTNRFITRPGAKNYAYGAHSRGDDLTYTWAVAGAAADILHWTKLPMQASLHMFESYLRWETFTSGATLSLGWQAYTDMDGAVQAANAAGILNAVSLTVNGAWSHGMLVVATPDDSLPVIFGRKDFNNRTPVDIIITIGSQAPGVGAHLEGLLTYYMP